MIWKYEVENDVEGMLWMLILNKEMGKFEYIMRRKGIEWDKIIEGKKEMGMVVVEEEWKKI